MGHRKEPNDVNFIIESPPLSDKERKEISEFIKKLKKQKKSTKSSTKQNKDKNI